MISILTRDNTKQLGITTFSLDPLGRIKEVVDHNNRNVRYDYDSVGNQTIVATELSETHYTYDSLKRQIEVIAKGDQNSNNQQESITKLLYNGYDLEQKIYPNNLVMHHQYDLMGRLTQVEQTDVDFKEFIRLVERHHYDPQGNATLEYKVDWFDNTLSENVKYQYDELNRLTKATETRGKFNRAYTYDTLGNLVEETDKSYYNDSTTVYSIDGLNRLTGKETTKVLQDKTREKAMFTYEFDKRGNMVAEVNELSGSRQSYTYDLTNRMVEGISHDKRTSSYQFNGMGSLVQHGRSTDRKEYLLDYTQQVPQELLEIQERRNTAYSYLGRDKLTSITATPLEKMILNYHHDMLGSVRYATDQQGQMQLSNVYSEWGEPRVTQRNKDEVSQPSYTGHMFDDVLGLYYAKARAYDPRNRRFGAEDLVKGFLSEPNSLNSYLYTLNNPLVYFDLDGEKPTPLEAALMARHIYDPTDAAHTLEGGWGLYVSNGVPKIIEGGRNMRMGVYFREIDGVREYALVNRGTVGLLKNNLDNAQQAINFLPDSPDVTASVTAARDFVESRSCSISITMVGHSKGGAEAIANAVATNRNAIVFNPAPPNATVGNQNLRDFTANINSFVVDGDVLHRQFGTTALDSIGGTTEVLPQQYPPNILGLNRGIANHRIGTVIKALSPTNPPSNDSQGFGGGQSSEGGIGRGGNGREFGGGQSSGGGVGRRQ